MVLQLIDQRYKKEDMEFIAKSVIDFENLIRTRKK